MCRPPCHKTERYVEPEMLPHKIGRQILQTENKIKVFLTGGDGLGWAIDEDIRLSAMALEGIVDLVSLEECQVVHMAWWGGLNLLPWDKLCGKWIVSHVPGEPFRYFSLMPHRHAVPLISTWISRNSQATR